MSKIIRKILVTNGIVAFIIAVAAEQADLEFMLLVVAVCIVSVMVLCTEDIKKCIDSNK